MCVSVGGRARQVHVEVLEAAHLVPNLRADHGCTRVRRRWGPVQARDVEAGKEHVVLRGACLAVEHARDRRASDAREELRYDRIVLCGYWTGGPVQLRGRASLVRVSVLLVQLEPVREAVRAPRVAPPCVGEQVGNRVCHVEHGAAYAVDSAVLVDHLHDDVGPGCTRHYSGRGVFYTVARV